MLITCKNPRNDTLKNTENSIYEAKNATFYHFNITFFLFSENNRTFACKDENEMKWYLSSHMGGFKVLNVVLNKI